MPHKPSVLVAHADIIGVLPDKQVGEIAGCTASRVRQWRIQHSIPARWRGETSMPSLKSLENEKTRRVAKRPRHFTVHDIDATGMMVDTPFACSTALDEMAAIRLSTPDAKPEQYVAHRVLKADCPVCHPRRAAKQVRLTPDQKAAVTVIAEAVHPPVPVDVRMSTSNAFVWTITLKDTDAALGGVELPGENEVMVVASDAVGAAKAALTLGTVSKIEMKFKVLLASDICPV